MSGLHALRFPVGQFEAATQVNEVVRREWIQVIENFPKQVAVELEGLEEECLDWTYRPGGWSIRQLVHHCADSHMNAYIRFKLALTEDSPNIKPYDEAKWADLPDTLQLDVSVSMRLLESLHYRWTYLLKNIDSEGYKRVFLHPEHGTQFTLNLALDNYQWHCRHHLEHIRIAKQSGRGLTV